MDGLFEAKDNQVYLDFETGVIDEGEMFSNYFNDKRSVDGDAVRAYMSANYRFIPGMEELLTELSAIDGFELHALSNYGPLYTLIEDKVGLSKLLPWSFVSCQTGTRKPDPAAFLGALSTLGIDPQDTIFIDDSATNCKAATELGIRSIRFEGDVAALRLELSQCLAQPQLAPPVLAPSTLATSTCRVCRESFVVAENGPRACCSHSGTLRGESARKGDWEGLVGAKSSADGDLVFSWSCCGGKPDAPGCQHSRHLTYDDA